jgi:acyl transferase domain-containing protein
MNAGTPPIAIIGMACRFAGADNPEQYWENLVGEVESIARSADGAFGPTSLRSERHVPAIAKVDDVECFDADFFGVPPAEAVIMDPQQRVLLEVAFEALEDAGRADTTDAVVGVFVGSGENVYHWDFVASNPRVQAKPQDLRVVLANAKDFLASRIAFKLGLTGPSITVQTACSTALTAVALACQALVAGDCDVALAGGVSLLMPDAAAPSIGSPREPSPVRGPGSSC